MGTKALQSKWIGIAGFGVTVFVPGFAQEATVGGGNRFTAEERHLGLHHREGEPATHAAFVNDVASRLGDISSFAPQESVVSEVRNGPHEIIFRFTATDAQQVSHDGLSVGCFNNSDCRHSLEILRVG